MSDETGKSLTTQSATLPPQTPCNIKPSEAAVRAYQEQMPPEPKPLETVEAIEIKRGGTLALPAPTLPLLGKDH